MKKSLCYSALIAGTALVFFSCQKTDALKESNLSEKSAKSKKSSCLISSLSYSNSNLSNQTIFTNHYDGSSRITQVDAGIFSGGSVLSSISLNIYRSQNGIAFVKTGTATDTVLFAFVNSKGRIEKIVPGNTAKADFLPTSFEYNGDQIAAMHISLAGNIETSYFNYDTKGNCTSIADAPTPDVQVPGKTEYEYATNEKAKQQFYLDEPRKFSWNSFSLLQYIGLFPELQPVNLRTATKVMWGNNYQAYNMKIANQQMDGQGKLISYDIIHPQTGKTVSHFNINWNCNSSTANQNDQQGNN